MKTDRIDVEYFIDYLGKAVHVLERKGAFNSDSLRNKMGFMFIEELIAQENLLQDVATFEWFCYCPNSPILAFKDYNLNLVSRNSETLHKPFLSALKAFQ